MRCLPALAVLALSGLAPQALADAEHPAKVAVMRTVVEGQDAAALQAIGPQVSSRIADQVKKRTGAEVISAEEIDTLLSHERDKQVSGCAEQSCLADIADALGADVVVQARVAKVDGGYAVSLSAIDSKKAQTLARVDERWGGEPLLLLDVIAPAVDKLFPTLGPPAAGLLVLEGVKDGSKILVDDAVKGTAPAGQLSVASGPHRLAITSEAHEPFSSWIIVATATTTSVPVSQVLLPAPPFYATWWFWTAVGGATVVAAGAGTGAWFLLGNDGGPGIGQTGVLVSTNGDQVLGGKR